MDAEQRDAVPVPPASLRFMGETEQGYVEIGSALARQLYEHGLGADGRLLDVGSGYGRLAAGLLATGYEGRYLGFDILPRHVAWCQRRLGRRPGYRFRHLDVHNARYNPRGTIRIERDSLPREVGEQDVLRRAASGRGGGAEDRARASRLLGRGRAGRPVPGPGPAREAAPAAAPAAGPGSPTPPQVASSSLTLRVDRRP